MRLHWFANDLIDPSTEELKDLIEVLNDAGYYSVLFAYHNAIPDPLIKTAHILDKTHSIKIMSALRTRVISPEYCAMLAAGFSSIQPNRIMFNILHGTLNENEDQIGIIDYDNIFSTRRGIIDHTRMFLEKINRLALFKQSGAELVVPGASKESIEIAIEYGDYAATDYHSFIKDPEKYSGANKVMVTLDIAFKDFSAPPEEDVNLIFIKESEFLDFINKMDSLGATDLMLAPPPNTDSSQTHKIIKKYSADIFAF